MFGRNKMRFTGNPDTPHNHPLPKSRAARKNGRNGPMGAGSSSAHDNDNVITSGGDEEGITRANPEETSLPISRRWVESDDFFW